MRLFFALWPPRDAAEALHAWASEVHRSSGGRVTRPETIHLTLAFLGEIEEKRLPLLQQVTLSGKRHSLPVDAARYWKHNQIVWVGPREMPREMRRLVVSLSGFLEKNEFRQEKREFAAHITLIRKARVPNLIPELPKVAWPVDEVVLVRSRLSAKGSNYEVVQRYPLD
ncbi:MAG TPA: RNA 2',3'-cyclic phosphodiesterase [Burkholderiales bacterium]|nr:RNA 2',3'-cyclic phosphodiesterase [Burkholderiales bacterium]